MIIEEFANFFDWYVIKQLIKDINMSLYIYHNWKICTDVIDCIPPKLF